MPSGSHVWLTPDIEPMAVPARHREAITDFAHLLAENVIASAESFPSPFLVLVHQLVYRDSEFHA